MEIRQKQHLGLGLKGVGHLWGGTLKLYSGPEGHSKSKISPGHRNEVETKQSYLPPMTHHCLSAVLGIKIPYTHKGVFRAADQFPPALKEDLYMNT
jgi:hypothetical protein